MNEPLTIPQSSASGLGRLPSFLIAGVAKSGSSSLYAYLAQHPQVFTSKLRAPNFFGLGEQSVPRYGGPVPTKNVETPSLEQYRALFAGVKCQIAIGEGSSFFNFTPRAAFRIRHYIPDAKLIFILRQPAERAYSQYVFARRMGWEPASTFKEALDAESVRRSEKWFPFLCYSESSRYAATLREYYRIFPRDQIHVSLSDDLRKNALAVVRRVYGFIGVDPNFTPDVSVLHNQARVRPFAWECSPLNARPAPIWKRIPASIRLKLWRGLDRVAIAPPRLDRPLRMALTSGARQDILETQQLIARDLSHWLTDDCEDARICRERADAGCQINPS